MIDTDNIFKKTPASIIESIVSIVDKGDSLNEAKEPKGRFYSKKVPGFDSSDYEAQYRRARSIDADTKSHVRDHIGPLLTKRGYTKAIDHPSREVWIKTHHGSGKVLQAVVHRDLSNHSVVTMSDGLHDGYRSTIHGDPTHYHKHLEKHLHDSEIDSHKASAVKAMTDHVVHWDNTLSRP